ncbi:hypothetical protein Poli38472_009637 [Pythium oligandrum]|uniref:Ion transport domain-containing protein n=1 Tax=Pythium oligandrum TaxID=41045 RepID=A0A8K1FIJ5_PYTOL|nr:hypothetical protein Poli38472_009637 [Pythium oligandrum]|eukprot:TMW62144.1 hypothetical protein Poli38472_009637 [Pythium oligandrum]
MYGALAVDSPVRVSEGAASAYGDRSESLDGRTGVERIEEEEDLLDRPGRVETAAADEHRRLIHTFIPVVCSIFGVILFMRLGTVVGAIGLRQTWIVIGIAFGITFLTIGSLSALASGNENARKARGILRALEQVVGTNVSQGLAGLFYLSFTIAAAYHLLGFSEIMLFYLGIDRREHKLPWSDEGSWSTLLLSSGLLLIVVILHGMGARVSRRALRVVFGVFAVAVVCSIMFLLIPDAKMHTGASVSRLQTNWDPESSEGVITMFGFFFPGFTGVIAGANLADYLVLSSFKYGSRSSQHGVGQVHLVVGTHTALVFSLLLYLGLSLVLAASADRKLLEEEHFVVQLVVDSFLGIPVIFLGVGFTTLSAAFANVAGAASGIQFLRPMQNNRGRTEDTNMFTRDATGFAHNQSSSDSADILWAWLLSQVCLLCGSVDSVIPVISATFLLVFAVVNFVCFYQEISNPAYKPFFSMYSKWTALLGLCLSLGGLFLVLSATFLVVTATCAVIVAIYCPGMFINIVGSVRRYSSGRSRALSSTIEESSTSTQSFEINQQVLFDQMPTTVAEQDDEYDNAVQLAALYVRDAIHGRFLGDAYATVSHHKLEIKRWFHALQYVRVANVLVLVLLSFFEVPSWCYYGESCGDPNVVLAWNLPRLPRTVTTLIELGNLIILTLEMTLKYKYLGKRLYFANKWHILQVIFVVANSVSVLLVMFVPDRMSMAGENGDLPPLVQAKIDGEEAAYSQLERFMPLFSCFYVIEMVIKLYANGAAAYFDSGKNLYDCVVTLVILTAEVSIQVHYSQGENWEWIRILLLLRFLRCLRLLVALQSISTMFGVVVRLLPAFTTLYGMLAIVMCEYAAVGVQLFGGKLVRGDPRLAEVAYGKDDYYPNNFNDYASAITTLFELLIVNNWNVIMEGVETVTSKWCRVYFLSFYVIAVVMVLNLVIAFIVEAYFEQAGASEPSDQLSKEKSSSEVDTPEQSLAEGSQASHHILRKRAFVVRPRADSVYIEEFL